MKKIIIVGSAVHLIEKEKNILSRSYFDIFSTTSAREALEIHRNNKVDLIVIDADMKDMRGDELCSEIRMDEDLKYISIILLCPSTETDIRRCKNSGSNAIIMKPFEPHILVDEVVKLINVPVRKDMRVLTSLEVEGKANNVPFIAKSENISVSGILIKTDRVFEKGDVITCSFHIDSERLTLKGEIVRVVKSMPDLNHYGIRFINMNPLPKRTIDRYIKKKRK
jgi:DNA-binding response OmpR family regulator